MIYMSMVVIAALLMSYMFKDKIKANVKRRRDLLNKMNKFDMNSEGFHYDSIKNR